jgi:hypothetical protein
MLTDGNHKPGSVKMGYYALHFLFTNIYHKNWAKAYLPTPKVAQTLPLVLSKDEVSDVLAAIDNFKHRVIGSQQPVNILWMLLHLPTIRFDRVAAVIPSSRAILLFV